MEEKNAAVLLQVSNRNILVRTLHTLMQDIKHILYVDFHLEIKMTTCFIRTGLYGSSHDIRSALLFLYCIINTFLSVFKKVVYVIHPSRSFRLHPIHVGSLIKYNTPSSNIKIFTSNMRTKIKETEIAVFPSEVLFTDPLRSH